MADKKLNEVSTATDGAYVYAEDASGNQIKISKADLATVVAGLIGLSSGTKKGLLPAGYLTFVSAYNYALYKIVVNNASWQRKTCLIKGSYNAKPIDIVVGTYGSENVNSFSVVVSSAFSIPSHIKFYKKANEVFVLFNIASGDLNYAWITTDSLVTQVSIGNSDIIDDTYTEVTY